MLERLRTLFCIAERSDGSADITRHQLNNPVSSLASRRYFISLLMPWGMLFPSTTPALQPFSQSKLDTIPMASSQTPAPAMVGNVVAATASAEEITLAERLDALQKQPTISSQIVDLKRSTSTQEATPSAIGGAVAQLSAFTNASVSAQSNAAMSFGLWPVDGSISQPFSAYHSGIDIQGPIGTDVHAVADGTVLFAGADGSGYGTYIVVDHGNGYQTLYGHLSKLEVAKDDKVTAGQEIGLRGSTGRSTGPHLHFEVIKDGKYQNPVAFLPTVVAETPKVADVVK